jgi:hypothetical protein
MARANLKPLVFAAAAAGFVIAAAAGIDAHKAVTSKYTYNEDVFPILRDKCGRCHTDGGPAPMSLLTYNENGGSGGAVAWAESMREMLTAEAMPPWYADPSGPAVKNNHALTPRELDILITWASGGTPQGNLAKKPAAPPAQFTWGLGKPDLELKLPEPQTLPPGEMEKDADVSVPTNFTEAKWVKAVDLLPATPSMVRRATIAVDNGPILAVWEPASDAIAAPGGTAFKIPAGAKLRVQVHYKKPWQEEQQSKSDQSTIGLYLTDEPLSGKEITSVPINGSSDESVPTAPKKFGGALATAGRVLAIRPSLDQPYASMEINAVGASGRKVPLLKLRQARPEWPRRYWLADPVELPAGTKIEVTAVPGDPDSGPLIKAVHNPLQVALDVVPQ